MKREEIPLQREKLRAGNEYYQNLIQTNERSMEIEQKLQRER